MEQAEPNADRIATLTAALRQDSSDLSMYAGFLLSTLAEALPPELVEVEREGSVFGRLRGRTPPVVGVAVSLGDRRWMLRQPGGRGGPRASVAHESGGVVLSRTELSVDEWTRGLAAALVDRAGRDGAAARALERLTIARGHDL